MVGRVLHSAAGLYPFPVSTRISHQAPFVFGGSPVTFTGSLAAPSPSGTQPSRPLAEPRITGRDSRRLFPETTRDRMYWSRVVYYVATRFRQILSTSPTRLGRSSSRCPSVLLDVHHPRRCPPTLTPLRLRTTSQNWMQFLGLITTTLSADFAPLQNRKLEPTDDLVP